MLRQKSCPRCKTGNVSVDRDQYGWYEYCIQCGYVRDLLSVVEPGEQAQGKRQGKTEASSKGE